MNGEKNLPKVENIEKLLQYNLVVQTYTAALQVPLLEFCNGFIVRNLGTATLLVMGDPLATGESKTVGGNRGEIYVGRLDLKTQGAGTFIAVVTQKYYMNIPRKNETT